MSANVGEVFIDYDLLKDLENAYRAKVFSEIGDESENEERHVSELKRRMVALDEKEVYIALRAFVTYHKDTVRRTLEYMNKEGELSNE